MNCKVILLLLITVLSFSSCKAADEAKLILLNENDYLNANIIEKTENNVFFKETISFEEAYPNVELLDLSSVEMPRDDGAAICVDNKGIIYYQFERSEKNPTGMICSYNPFTKEWCTLVETDESHNCAVETVKNDYLVWQEDENSNWLKSSLHLLDLKTKKDVKFYTFTVDPSTNLMYSWRWKPSVIIGDKVYFDDTVGKTDDIYKIKVFSYSISKNKITELDEDARYPQEYLGDVRWLKMSEDKKNSLFYSAKQDRILFKSTTELGTVFASSNKLIVANDNLRKSFFDTLSEKKNSETESVFPQESVTTAGNGIKIFVNDKVEPILATFLENISDIETNGDIVTWTGETKGGPIFYSYSKDRIIKFDQTIFKDVWIYGFMHSDNYAIVNAVDTNNKRSVYMWDLRT